MTVLLIILYVVLGIIAIILLVALFTKKSYRIQREILIHRPKDQVFDYIKYLNNQDKFSYWATIDPNMKRDSKGVDGTAGFVYYWDSPVKAAGKGEQEIVKIEEGRKIDYEVRFIRPFEGRSDATLSTDTVSGSDTNVTWSFASKMKYPMNAMLLFMDMEKLIGRDLMVGLTNLKTLLEKK